MKIKRLPTLDSTPERVNVGERIRIARTECGLSQKELANQCGFTSATAMSLYESNSRNLSVRLLEQISHVTNLPVNFFIE